MRAGGSLRVILDAKDGPGFVAQPLDAAVIQIHMGYLHLSRQRPVWNCKTVVVAGDGDAPLIP